MIFYRQFALVFFSDLGMSYGISWWTPSESLVQMTRKQGLSREGLDRLRIHCNAVKL
jgi:hypothetical protein